MQRRIEQLISKVRKRTSNNGSSSNITDDEIVDSINEAQEALMEIIISNFGMRSFRKTSQFNLQSGVYEYDLPADLYDNGFIEKIEFSSSVSPTEQNWTTLNPIQPNESNIVEGYLIRNGKLTVQFGFGSIRIWYIGKPVYIDKRRGKVSEIGANYIKIQDFDQSNDLSADDWVTCVDNDGTIKQDSIYKESFNVLSGKIATNTILTNVEIGDYIVLGKKASSHSELRDRFERYLRTWAVTDLSIFDSSEDFNKEAAKLKVLEASIADIAFHDSADVYEPALTDV